MTRARVSRDIPVVSARYARCLRLRSHFVNPRLKSCAHAGVRSQTPTDSNKRGRTKAPAKARQNGAFRPMAQRTMTA
jgi:hypothetical protein